jgi:ribonuclease E
MALEMNLEAIPEIVRHLRLRDLGGVVVIDFIDMRLDKHCRQVERQVREALKRDRAKTKVLKMSQFGIVELTRQRMRASHERSISIACPTCSGTGQVKSIESVGLDVMRLVQLAMHNRRVDRVEVLASPGVCEHLQNRRRRTMVRLEEATGKQLDLLIDPDTEFNAYRITCFDDRQQTITLANITEAAREDDKPRQKRRRSRKREKFQPQEPTLAEELGGEIEDI